MKKVYNKLVRDNIPAIIEKNGKKANYRVLAEDEYKQALKAKLVEEVNEFLKAETIDEQEEELADIIGVILAINTVFSEGKNFNVVDKGWRKEKEKGNFKKRYFLESVED